MQPICYLMRSAAFDVLHIVFTKYALSLEYTFRKIRILVATDKVVFVELLALLLCKVFERYAFTEF